MSILLSDPFQGQSRQDLNTASLTGCHEGQLPNPSKFIQASLNPQSVIAPWVTSALLSWQSRLIFWFDPNDISMNVLSTSSWFSELSWHSVTLLLIATSPHYSGSASETHQFASHAWAFWSLVSRPLLASSCRSGAQRARTRLYSPGDENAVRWL